MNILQVTLGFAPAYNWGGPVKTVHLSCKELVRRGHSVTVYCTNLFDKKSRIQPRTFERTVDGIRVVYFNTWNIPGWPGTLGPVWLPDMHSYLERELPGMDVVHINGYRSTMHIPVAQAARRFEVPFVVQPRGSMPVIISSFFLKRLYDRTIGAIELDGLSAVIALQQSERQQAMAHGVPPECIEIIPNGIDLTARDSLPDRGAFRCRYGISLERPVVLFLGRINKKKGADMLVEAFSQMDPRLNALLVVAGPDDGHLAEVQERIRRFGIEDKVVFTGLLSHEQAMEAFRDADVFVLPCRTDTFPMAIVEACLSETPMVITDRCEIAHLVKDRVGSVTPFDACAFGEAVEGLLKDRARYEFYRSACKQTLEDTFSLQSIGDKLEALYARVIAEKRTTQTD